MQAEFDDSRLIPIRAKVEDGERLSFEDGLFLEEHGLEVDIRQCTNVVPEVRLIIATRPQG